MTQAVMNPTPDLSIHILSLPSEILAAIASELHIQRGFLQDAEFDKRRLHRNNVSIRSLCSLALTCKIQCNHHPASLPMHHTVAEKAFRIFSVPDADQQPKAGPARWLSRV
jgi:hypothetical protein